MGLVNGDDDLGMTDLAEGKPVLEPYTDTSDQRWAFQQFPVGDTFVYAISNVASGLYITTDGESVTLVHQPFHLTSNIFGKAPQDGGFSNQLFALGRLDNGWQDGNKYVIVIGTNPNLALYRNDGNEVDITTVCVTSPSQQWTIRNPDQP